VIDNLGATGPIAYILQNVPQETQTVLGQADHIFVRDFHNPRLGVGVVDGMAGIDFSGR